MSNAQPPPGPSQNPNSEPENGLQYNRPKWVWIAAFVGLIIGFQQISRNTYGDGESLAQLIDLALPTLLIFFIADFIARRKWRSQR